LAVKFAIPLATAPQAPQHASCMAAPRSSSYTTARLHHCTSTPRFQRALSMKIAYFDLASGIAGDMALAALIDAGADLAKIQAALASLGIAGLTISTSEVRKKGFRALQLQVVHPAEQAHRHLHHITDMIDASELNTRQK